MNRIIAYCITTILALAGFGCQSSSHSNATTSPHQTIHLNMGDDPQTLDPRRARALNCQMVCRMLFEGLVRVNRDEKVELALAERMEVSSDLKTYTFHLKESLWSNGDPVRASDFVYAWKKVLAPDFPSDNAFHLYVIQNAKTAKEGKSELDAVGLSAPDEHTLIITLESPTPYLLELLAAPVFFPVNPRIDASNPAWAQTAETHVGNGPFTLSSWKHQDKLEVRKNPTYWDAASVKLASIELCMLTEDTELKMFEKKELDWAGSPLSKLPVDALAPLKKEGLLHTKELLATYFIRVNTEQPPFNDARLRKALALAINRQEIVEHVTRGGQAPAMGLVPQTFGLQSKPCFQDADKESAKELFAEALAAQEKMPEITLLYRTGERNHLLAQAFQQQWLDAFGVRVNLQAVEGKVFFDRVSRQDYQLVSGDWIADFSDPLNFLEVFKYKKGGSNNTLWENPRYVELLDLSAQTANEQERRELFAQSEQILMREMPIIPIFYHTMLYVNQPSLKDVVLSSMGQIDFRWASVEDKR